jgi:hypothetical protein
VRKVDRLSLILIDLNIPAFTLGRHGIEATLDFPQNITLLAFCRV